MPTRYIFDTEEAIRHLSQLPTLAPYTKHTQHTIDFT